MVASARVTSKATWLNMLGPAPMARVLGAPSAFSMMVSSAAAGFFTVDSDISLRGRRCPSLCSDPALRCEATKRVVFTTFSRLLMRRPAAGPAPGRRGAGALVAETADIDIDRGVPRNSGARGRGMIR